jgi:hypothetical protein
MQHTRDIKATYHSKHEFNEGNKNGHIKRETSGKRKVGENRLIR